MLKKLLSASVAFFSLFGLVILFFQYSVLSAKDPKKEFKKSKIVYFTEIVKNEYGEIRIVKVGEDNKNKIVFIHGSPGSWNDFLPMIKKYRLDTSFQIILYDRLGQGASKEKKELSLKSQTEAISPFLKKTCVESSCILIGHSYGGSVIASILTKLDTLFTCGLFVAPCFSPEYQQPRWYNKIAKKRLARIFLGRSLENSNTEMMRLPDDLLLLKKPLQKVKTNVVYLQGENDILVPIESVKYAKEIFSEKENIRYIIKKKMNHFIPWKNQEEFRYAINVCSTLF